jgi:predicted metalloprotease
MTFNEGSDISGGRVSKRGRNAAIGAGGGGLLVIGLLIASQFLGVDLTGLAPIIQGGTGGTVEETPLDQCQTGEDANENIDCRMKGTAAALETYWATQVDGYTSPNDMIIFTDSVGTGCGSATSAVGPFYCPPDRTIYLDTAFYDDLRTQFGASGGNLAQIYVVAHEWGHHIQNITGRMNGLDLQDQGPTSDGVRLELQADCYAGSSIAALSTTEDENGVPFLKKPTDAEIADALNAAAAVGDDHIQETLGGGQVNPETWTHGSSESRQKWFMAGYQGGVGACDTFAVSGSQL